MTFGEMVWRRIVAPAFSLLYNYSGLRFVVGKFTGDQPNDPDYERAPSGPVWLLGVYIAMFGIASQLYQQATQEHTAAVVPEREPASATSIPGCVANAVDELRRFRLLPVKPHLLRPRSVVESIFWQRVPSLPSTAESNDFKRVALELIGTRRPFQGTPLEARSYPSDPLPPARVAFLNTNRVSFRGVPKAASTLVTTFTSPAQSTEMRTELMSFIDLGDQDNCWMTGTGLVEASRSFRVHTNCVKIERVLRFKLSTAPNTTIEAFATRHCPASLFAADDPTTAAQYNRLYDCSVLLLLGRCSRLEGGGTQ